MLVNRPEEHSHWDVVGPDQTKSLELWMKEVIGVESIEYRGDLEGLEVLGPGTVVIANYDWIVNAIYNPLQGGFRRLWRLIRHAQALGVPIWCHNFDLFSIRYSFYTSLLAGLTGGATVFLQNTIAQAKKFGIANPSAPHFWIFPPSIQGVWTSNQMLQNREPLVLIAQSGDERRRDYFEPAFPRFESFGYVAQGTEQKLGWEEYVSLVKSSRIICTTSWLQPLFLKGPPRFQNRLADGIITHRVLEAFSVGALLVTNPIDALSALGFHPGIHYIAAPRKKTDWEAWELPVEKKIIEIADNGHQQFLLLLRGEWREKSVEF